MLTACASGAAPTITSITTPEPASVSAKTTSQVTVKISVLDEDADLQTLRIALRAPDGDGVEKELDVRDQVGNARNSTVTLLLEVAPPSAGTYDIEVVAIDSEANESAPLSTELTATDP